MKHPLNSLRPSLTLACTSLVAAVSHVSAAIVTNGLLVELDAASYTTGSPWVNTGSVGGSFAGSSLGLATPTVPTRTTIDGAPGVLFDNTDLFIGPQAPAGVTGTGTRTVEVWVYQSTVGVEETLLAWGRRGGPEGTNNSLNWGTSSAFGAFGGWGGGPDMGFGAGQPASGAWRHIAFAYDGANKSVYVDGVLASSEPQPSLSTHADHQFLLGAQHAPGSTPGTPVIDGGNRLTGVIGRVRVHDGALSAADVLNNYNVEKGAFQPASLPVSPLTAGPVHRWSFNETSGNTFANTGTLGGAAAQLKGTGGALTGSGVDLPGGSSATQAYIDLPNNAASGKDAGPGYGSVFSEVWVTAQSIQTWSRIMDFGTSTVGEVNDVGGSFNGSNYILLSNNIGGASDMRMEMVGAPVLSGNGTRDTAGATIIGSPQHIVMSYDAADGHWKWYRNGDLMEAFPGSAPSTLNDVNNWLGRSNWAADLNTDALYDEFRIYNYALTDAQIRQNLLDGPNALTIIPEPASAALGVLGFGLLARRRRS